MKAPTRTEVLAEVRIICKSERFAGIDRGKQILRYIVNETLNHPSRTPVIKALTIGIEVFGEKDYDPKKKATVKTAMRDLRLWLEDYYAKAGRNDRVRIKLEPGSYVPIIAYNPAILALELEGHDLQAAISIKRALSRRDAGGVLLAQGFIMYSLTVNPFHPKLLSLGAMISAEEARFGGPPDEKLQFADMLMQRIPNPPPPMWEVMITQAWLKAVLNWDWKEAELLFDHAISLGHDEAKHCLSWYAAFLASQLRFDEAVAVAQEALEAHPESAPLRRDLAMFHLMAGNPQSANEIVNFESYFAHSGPLHRAMFEAAAMVFEAWGDFRRAVEILESEEYRPEPTGLYYLVKGLSGDVLGAREGFDLLSQDSSVASTDACLAAIGAGEYDFAVKCAASCVSNHDPNAILFGVMPCMRHLRQHPGFRAVIMQKMKLSFPQY
jgi:tetratricopeptide (TPR) repeat protein